MDYFAYGSNLNKQQMRQRCPDCKPKFSAVLPHYKLIFTGWSREWKGGTASIKPVRGEKVAGVIYDISEKDLQRLDRFEGYPTTYNRINVLVLTDASQAIKAFTYVKRIPGDETLPSREYAAIIKQGYKDWGIE